jgi:hypothetical protein
MSNYVKEWLERGRKSANPIDSFRDYWAGFNAEYKSVSAPSERDKVSKYVEEKLNAADAQKILEEFVEEINYLVSSPVIDMRMSGRSTEYEIDEFESSSDPVKDALIYSLE